MKLNCIKNMDIYEDYLNSILSLHPNAVVSLDSAILSAYTIALARYNIYRQFKVNELKVEKMRLERNFDIETDSMLTKAILKEYTSKSAAISCLIVTNTDLKIKAQQIFELKCELELGESIDKAISELIAAFKRELTRRDNELSSIRKGV